MAEQKTKKEQQKSTVVSRDEVDASKGVFPFGTKHPEGAELKQAGEMGGTRYEESGRSGLDTMANPEGISAEAIEQAAEIAAGPEPRASKPEAKEPKGELPRHRESHA